MKRMRTMIFFAAAFVIGCAASALGSDALTFFDSGTVFYNDGKFADAVREYSKAIAVVHDHSEPYYYRGKAYYNLHQYDEAIEDFNKAIIIKSNDADMYYDRGLAYFRK